MFDDVRNLEVVMDWLSGVLDHNEIRMLDNADVSGGCIIIFEKNNMSK